MSLRDYEFVQEARRTGKILISVKGLTRALECDPVACQGLCCRGHNPNLTSHYHNGELSKLPSKFLEFIDTKNNNAVRINNKGECLLIPYCLENPAMIPTECRLFPLGFNRWGRLVMKRWAWMKPCPAYNKGRPIYIAMKQCLIDIFGEKIYLQIAREITPIYLFTESSNEVS